MAVVDARCELAARIAAEPRAAVVIEQFEPATGLAAHCALAGLPFTVVNSRYCTPEGVGALSARARMWALDACAGAGAVRAHAYSLALLRCVRPCVPIDADDLPRLLGTDISASGDRALAWLKQVRPPATAHARERQGRNGCCERDARGGAPAAPRPNVFAPPPPPPHPPTSPFRLTPSTAT